MWSGFVDWTSRTEPGTPLAVFRIVLGATLVWMFADMLARGLVDVVWVDRAYGGYRALGGNWLIAALGGATPPVMHGLTWAALVSCALRCTRCAA